MKAVYFPNQSIFLGENGSSLQNVFGSGIVSTVNEAMIEGSVDLRDILVELLFVVLVEVVEIDGFRAEDEVIEGGNADIVFH